MQDSSDAGAAPLVVGVGASAGGVSALRRLLARIPPDVRLGFVVVVHLGPEHPSMLASVLGAGARLPVVEAATGMVVEPGRVHVIPSESDLRIDGGTLRLVPRETTRRLHLPIDSFFRSLADAYLDRAIGVVLSGLGTDGTEGLRAIACAGGFAMAQDPASAEFDSMPASAIASGTVDFRGSPEAIADELVRLGHQPDLARSTAAAPDDVRSEALETIFTQLRRYAGVDFSGYKRSTVRRRIERRVTLRRAQSFAEYASSLAGDPEEVRSLAREMLIHVTSFFRDPAAFEALASQVLEPLVESKRRSTDAAIRVWVPGCATGEEVHSLAILLVEALDAHGAGHVQMKIFGTDLSEEAIETARRGVYADSVLAEVSPERLGRHFVPAEHGYRVSKRIRDLGIFVKHDLTRDPPFAKLDLISCRNVLIYMEPELQRRVVPMLHYCLAEGGHIFLGQSEVITGFRDLFVPLDRGHRIFTKIGRSPPMVFPGGAVAHGEPERSSEPARSIRHDPLREAGRQADHLLLARFAPAGVVIDDQLQIVQFRGRTGAYLEAPPGHPQSSVLRMARGGLAPALNDVIERARAQGASARREGVRVQGTATSSLVDLEVVPLTASSEQAERYFLVLFLDHVAGERSSAAVATQPTESGEESVAEIVRLRDELVTTKDYLQSLISEQEATRDELAVTNEELLAANEELQSTVEELQAAKEELQSANEELSTLNDQLRSRNQELDQNASDLVNILSSVEIPVVIVDGALRVRRFTPTAHQIANMISSDVGRPIDDLKLKVEAGDLVGRIREVLATLSAKEWEVQGDDGRWYRMHIRPYRTVDDRLDGAVLSFIDVDALRRTRDAAASARDYARNIVETVTDALLVLGPDLVVRSANESFCETFGVARGAVEGTRLAELPGELWARAPLVRAIERALVGREPFGGLELSAALGPGRHRVFTVSGRPMSGPQGPRLLLLALDDVTDLRRLERERARILESETAARREADRANRAKDYFLATLSHELRTPLGTMQMSAQLLELAGSQSPVIARSVASIRRAVEAQARLIDDLLDVSRIASGKLVLELGSVDVSTIVKSAVETLRPTARAKGIALELDVADEIGLAWGDAARLTQVVNNLLTNAIKFTPHDGRVDVRLVRRDARAELTVRDTGVGIHPDLLPHVFDRFVQADGSVTRAHGGLGLGLSIVRHLVEAHGGEVSVTSEGLGKGATFRVLLPLDVASAQTLPSSPPSISAQRIDGVRVLVVEDDEDTREALAGLLSRVGAEVRATGSAAEALSALSDAQPDVIVSDVAMPGEDGCALIRRIRGLDADRGGRIPAIALTALASEGERRAVLEAGFQVHLAKPVDAARLASVIAALVSKKA